MSRRAKTIIHVNQAIIRANKRTGAQAPVLTVKCGRKNTYAHEAIIDGPSRVIYSPDKPLSCGARVWIEVPAGVEVKTTLMSGEEESQQ